jgi:hypothetical protein
VCVLCCSADREVERERAHERAAMAHFALWRAARERATWLCDLRRCVLSPSAPAAAYHVLFLADR